MILEAFAVPRDTAGRKLLDLSGTDDENRAVLRNWTEPTAAEWEATGATWNEDFQRWEWDGGDGPLLSIAFADVARGGSWTLNIATADGSHLSNLPSAREVWEFVVACQVATWRWRCESCGMEFDRQPSFPDGTPRNWHVAPDGYGSCGDVVLAAPAVSPPAEPVSTPEVTEATDDR